MYNQPLVIHVTRAMSREHANDVRWIVHALLRQDSLQLVLHHHILILGNVRPNLKATGAHCIIQGTPN